MTYSELLLKEAAKLRVALRVAVEGLEEALPELQTEYGPYEEHARVKAVVENALEVGRKALDLVPKEQS